jgi:hypothetical protein
MKLLNTQWLVMAAMVGLLTSNVACGGDGEGGKAGSSGGGTTGNAGTSGGGTGGGVAPRVSFTFDSSGDKQGWSLSTYVDTNYKNLGAATDPDSGVSLDGGMVPTFEWANEGDPAPGCMKLTTTFTGFKEYVDPQINLATPADLSLPSHNYIRARIRLASGTFPAGGIQFHASSGLQPPNNYVYVAAPFINASSLTLGTWITITLDTSAVENKDVPPRPFDPTQVIQIGIQFTTGDPFEGGVPVFGQAVFEIDTIQG